MSISDRLLGLIVALMYGLILAIPLSSCRFQKRLPQSENFEIVKIDKGIYGAIHKVGGRAICNMGIVNLGESTLLFDSFLSPRVTHELLEALKKMGLPEVKYVVNSHYHNDHIRGNQIFDDDVEIISSVKTAELIRSVEPTNLIAEKNTAPAQLAFYDSLYVNFNGDTGSVHYQDINMWRPYYHVLVAENASIKPTLPSNTISDITTIKGQSISVLLVPTEQGHSQGDLYLHIPELNIVFAGDLMFKNIHPFLGAGDLDAWMKTLKKITGLNPKIILPGHGSLANKEDIRKLIDYMKHIQSLVAQGISKGNPPMPSEYRTWLLADFYSLNIQLLTRKNEMQSK